MEETELQRYERLCKEAGITIVTMNFFVKPELLYKFFRVVVKDCEKLPTKEILPTRNQPSESVKFSSPIIKKQSIILTDNQQKIIDRVRNHPKNTRQISVVTGLAIRTVQQHTKILGELGLLIKDEKTNKWRKVEDE